MLDVTALPPALAPLLAGWRALLARCEPAAPWLRSLADAWRDADAALHRAASGPDLAEALAGAWACRVLSDAVLEIECDLDAKADAALGAADPRWARGRLEAMDYFSEGAPDGARVSSGWWTLLDGAEGAWLDEVVARWRRCTLTDRDAIEGAVVEAYARDGQVDRALDALGRVASFGCHDCALQTLLPRLSDEARAFALDRAWDVYARTPPERLQYAVESLRGVIARESPARRGARLEALCAIVNGLESHTDMTGDCPAHRDLRAEVALAFAAEGDIARAVAWLRRVEAVTGTAWSQFDVIAALPQPHRDELGAALLARTLPPDDREGLYADGPRFCELSPALARACVARLDPDDHSADAVALRLAAAAQAPDTAAAAFDALAALLRDEATREAVAEWCPTLADGLARLAALDRPEFAALVAWAFGADDPVAIAALVRVRPTLHGRALEAARAALSGDPSDDLRRDWCDVLDAIARAANGELAAESAALRAQHEPARERDERALREGADDERLRAARREVARRRGGPLRAVEALRAQLEAHRDERLFAARPPDDAPGFGADAAEAVARVDLEPHRADLWDAVEPFIPGAPLTEITRLERVAQRGSVVDRVWCALALRSAALGDAERASRCVARVGTDYLRDDVAVRAALALGSPSRVQESLRGVLEGSQHPSVRATALEQVGGGGYVRCVDAVCSDDGARSVEDRARARLAASRAGVRSDATPDDTRRLAQDALALRDDPSVEATTAMAFAAAALDGDAARALLAACLSPRRRNHPWWHIGIARSPVTVAAELLDPPRRAQLVDALAVLARSVERTA